MNLMTRRWSSYLTRRWAWTAARLAAKYAFMFVLCWLAFHSLARVPGSALFTGGLIDQADANERDAPKPLRDAAVYGFLLIAAASYGLAYWAERRRRTGWRRLAALPPIVYFVAASPFFAAHVVFAVAFTRWALLSIFGPIALFAALTAWRKLSLPLLLALTMATISVNFSALIKGHRGVSAAEALRVARQPAVRPLLLTPSAAAPELAAWRLAPGLDVQDILVDPNERFLYAPTGSNYEDRARVVDCPLLRIDLATGEVSSLPISQGARPMALDRERRRLYLGTDYTEAVIVEIDLDTFEEVARVPAQKLGSVAALELFYLDQPRETLWVFHEWGLIEKWRVNPLRREGSFPGYGMHEYLALPGADEVYFQAEGVPPGLLRYRLGDAPTLTGKLLLPVSYGLDFDSRRGLIYLTDPFLARVWAVEPRSMCVVGSHGTVAGAKNIVYDARRDWIYVGSYPTGWFHIYDAATWRELGRVYAGQRFRRIALAPESGRVFTDTSRGVIEVDVEALARKAAAPGGH